MLQLTNVVYGRSGELKPYVRGQDRDSGQTGRILAEECSNLCPHSTRWIKDSADLFEFRHGDVFRLPVRVSKIVTELREPLQGRARVFLD